MMYQGPIYDINNPARFAPQIQALSRQCGVYAIYVDGSPQYVGVSTRFRLYGTVTRHVQKWSDRKDGTSPGFTWDRFRVVVAVQTFDDPSDAARAEAVWIAELRPALNKQTTIPPFPPEAEEPDESEPADLTAAELEDALSFDPWS